MLTFVRPVFHSYIAYIVSSEINRLVSVLWNIDLIADELFVGVFDHFVGLTLERLNIILSP